MKIGKCLLLAAVASIASSAMAAPPAGYQPVYSIINAGATSPTVLTWTEDELQYNDPTHTVYAFYEFTTGTVEFNQSIEGTGYSIGHIVSGVFTPYPDSTWTAYVPEPSILLASVAVLALRRPKKTLASA